jgi:hypothetical protein
MRHNTCSTIMKYLLLLIFAIALGLCPLVADVSRSDGTIFTSIIRVISSPEKYNGKKIFITGYYSSGFERSGLFLSRDDAHVFNSMQALWIGAPKEGKSLNYPKEGFVRIVGTLLYEEGKGSGHMGAYLAELQDIEEMRKVK